MTKQIAAGFDPHEEGPCLPKYNQGLRFHCSLRNSFLHPFSSRHEGSSSPSAQGWDVGIFLPSVFPGVISPCPLGKEMKFMLLLVYPPHVASDLGAPSWDGGQAGWPGWVAYGPMMGSSPSCSAPRSAASCLALLRW